MSNCVVGSGGSRLPCSAIAEVNDTLTGASGTADGARQDDTRSRNLWSVLNGQ